MTGHLSLRYTLAVCYGHACPPWDGVPQQAYPAPSAPWFGTASDPPTNKKRRVQVLHSTHQPTRRPIARNSKFLQGDGLGMVNRYRYILLSCGLEVVDYVQTDNALHPLDMLLAMLLAGVSGYTQFQRAYMSYRQTRNKHHFSNSQQSGTLSLPLATGRSWLMA